jgi:hypothetical protein
MVIIKNGSYYGVYQETYDQDLFLGMPYAQPPVGDLRFRNRAPLDSTWTDSQERDGVLAGVLRLRQRPVSARQRGLGGLLDDQRGASERHLRRR